MSVGLRPWAEWRPIGAMSLAVSVVEGLLTRGVPALLPLLRRYTNAELLERVPSLPGSELRGLLGLPTLPGRDSAYFFLNFLRHADRRGWTTARLEERVRQYLVRPVILSELARAEARRRHGIGGLQSIVLTPTVACNLRCEHCYNLFEIHEDNRERLPLDLMHRVIGEARALGAYRASFIGGEPLLRASDLAELGRAYPDVLMTVFTNGLLLTGAMADELAALGNVELSFSIDGFEVDHDRWRGPGTRRKTLESMARYHQAGGMALFSPTVTSENHRDLLSDRFLDEMAAHGAYMGYLHHYDLVGGQRRADWLLDRGQLAWMKARIEEIHRTRDLALLSNVVSDLVAGGCPAARDFVHINHKGEVEPCCMVPFAADNVKDRPLLDALRSPFFARISAIEPDAVGIKRCLVGENIGEMGAAVRAGEARGTTLVASQSLPSARRSLPLAPRAAEDLPTCFSQPAAP